MRRRSADAATALEIGVLTGSAAVVAVVVALPASALVLELLDPVPTVLPDPLFAVPWGSLAVVAAGVVVVTVGGALLVGRARAGPSRGRCSVRRPELTHVRWSTRAAPADFPALTGTFADDVHATGAGQVMRHAA